MGPGRRWKRAYGKTVVHNLDEAIVWIVAHEAFHWLRHTRQVPGRNTEVEADAFADRQLTAFREPLPATEPALSRDTWKQSLFDFNPPPARTRPRGRKTL